MTHPNDGFPREIKLSTPRSRRASEEDQAWARLYREIDQPSAAAEVVKFFKAHPEKLTDATTPLFMLAQRTLTVEKERKERIKRSGLFLRVMIHFLVVKPTVVTLRGVRWLFAGGWDVALAAMPDQPVSPAAAQVAALRKDASIAPVIESLSKGMEASSRRSNAA